jgi:transcriptional regulator with XRE-family HTH domain
MTFGERLKQRREEKGLTQEDVAAFFGTDFSRQSVSKWERGEAFPEVEKLLRLSVNLDISLDKLFTDELSYFRYGTGKEEGYVETTFPGLVAGLKTLADKLRQLK